MSVERRFDIILGRDDDEVVESEIVRELCSMADGARTEVERMRWPELTYQDHCVDRRGRINTTCSCPGTASHSGFVGPDGLPRDGYVLQSESESPVDEYRCTRPRGHDGDHEAATLYGVLCWRWPKLDAHMVRDFERLADAHMGDMVIVKENQNRRMENDEKTGA